jgi:hypothetical protein
MSDTLTFSDLNKTVGVSDNPFLPYPDHRFFVPVIQEQTEAVRIVNNFLLSDAENGLIVFTVPTGWGKTTIAKRIVNSFTPGIARGANQGVYMDGNLLLNNRQFLIDLLEMLGVEGHRSNEQRLKNFYNYVDGLSSGILLLIDNEPTDFDLIGPALVEFLEWSKDHENKIRIGLFARDLIEPSEYLGKLQEHLAHYQRFSGASIPELVRLLVGRCKMTGMQDPAKQLFSDEAWIEFAEKGSPSISAVLRYANTAFEKWILDKKESQRHEFNF